MTVTYQVAGGGHLDIDFWVNTKPTPPTSPLPYDVELTVNLTLCADERSQGPSPG